MRLEKYQIDKHNQSLLADHKRKFEFAAIGIENVESVIQKLIDFNVAIPSWALGTGGSRFGRFSGEGEPGNLEEIMEDVGLLHALNRSSGAISLYILWIIPEYYSAITTLTAQLSLNFDAVIFNTFKYQKYGTITVIRKQIG